MDPSEIIEGNFTLSTNGNGATATDGAATDVDPATGSATLLAADRARTVAALLAPLVGPARLRIATDPLPRGRTATATLAFVGERPPRSSR